MKSFGSHEPEKEAGSEVYFPETRALVDALHEDPKIALECSHGGEFAVGVYEVPRGCVALPGLETQKLCPQHILTDGSFEGMHLVVDLSLDAAWSKQHGWIPDYWMKLDPTTQKITMLEFATSPFES
ncbi:MAG TPA: hypothetical protein VIH90_04175 [Candidatus Saccharimonadales bacterium]